MIWSFLHIYWTHLFNLIYWGTTTPQLLGNARESSRWQTQMDPHYLHVWIICMQRPPFFLNPQILTKLKMDEQWTLQCAHTLPIKVLQCWMGDGNADDGRRKGCTGKAVARPWTCVDEINVGLIGALPYRPPPLPPPPPRRRGLMPIQLWKFKARKYRPDRGQWLAGRSDEGVARKGGGNLCPQRQP